MGKGVAHGSMSSGSGSVLVGLILTLRIPSSRSGDAMYKTPETTSSKGLQRPVWEAPKEGTVAGTCASKGLQRPVWLDTEQSKYATKSYNALLAP